ncbi:MAG TPA: hypothetical protein DHV96_01375 [Lachnospiraceae bacterium]|nr:hypothetical protein [Lachnospiraceae bacterium]
MRIRNYTIGYGKGKLSCRRTKLCVGQLFLYKNVHLYLGSIGFLVVNPRKTKYNRNNNQHFIEKKGEYESVFMGK